jgi:ParB-like chromosome segregation protein Spo0J
VNDKRIIEIAITDIKITKSFRKDLGDIEALADNIDEVGLLQPIGVTPDNRLVFGKRRLRAYQMLGRKMIPARVIDLDNILLGKFAENFFRKDYTVSERVAIVEAMRSFNHGGDRRSKQVRKCDDENLTVDEAAKRAGLGGKDGYTRAKKVLTNGVPELVEAMDSGRLSLSAAATLAEAKPEEQTECLTKRLDEKKWTACGVQRVLQKIRNANDRQEALNKSVLTPDAKDAVRIHHCGFQKLEEVAGLAPASAQLICTDIPYGKEFLPELKGLAEFAERVLVPGGLFVTYSGQYWLAEVIRLLGDHLTYRWMLASVWDGEGTVVHPRHAISKWKPVLVYSKGEWKSRGRWPDVMQVCSREKQHHDWQQPLEEAERLVSYFSQPGDLVIDPCGGSFTTGLACQTLGRRFVGCDIDKAAVVKGQQRLRQTRTAKPNLLPMKPDSSVAQDEVNLADSA